MSLRQLLRKPSVSLRSTPPSRTGRISRRFQSSTPNPNASKAQARATRVLDRVPRILRPYTNGLRNAPVSHLISFLLLHELTAVVPLVGLAVYFHYTNWLPTLADNSSIATYIETFTRYFRRKEWFGFTEASDVSSSISDQEREEYVDGGIGMERDGSRRGRIVWEVATAYAITKALLPVRLLLSVWATPWFARVVIGKIWGGLVSIGGRVAGKRAAATGTGLTRMGSAAVRKDAPRR